MQVLISFLNFLEHIPWFYRAQGYAFLRNIFFPAFQGSAGPFPLHCLTATRLRGPFQSGLGLYVKNSWKSDFGAAEGTQRYQGVALWAENTHSLKLRCGYGEERTRQRSFKPRSEFNFLFRDTAGFQTDLPGSGTQN